MKSPRNAVTWCVKEFQSFLVYIVINCNDKSPWEADSNQVGQAVPAFIGPEN
jgi:hypothetical protein